MFTMSTSNQKSKRYHHGDLRNALIQAGQQLLAEEGLAGLEFMDSSGVHLIFDLADALRLLARGVLR